MKHQRSRPYDKKQLARFRDKLVAMLGQARGDAELLAEEVLQPSGQESGLENPADFGSDAFNEQLQVQALEGQAALLQKCQEALDRLDGLGDHEYGLCKPCAEEPRRLCPTCPWIPPERLSYLPCARHCVPVEEELEERSAAQLRS